LVIAPVQPVAEPDFLRGGKAQGGVADFDVTTPWREANEPINRVVLPVGTDALHVDRRRDTILPQPAGVDHLDDPAPGEPQASIRRLRDARLQASRPLSGYRTVEHVEHLDLYGSIRVLPPLF